MQETPTHRRPGARYYAFRMLTYIAIAYVIYGALMFFGQRWMLYPRGLTVAERASSASPDGTERHTLTLEGGPVEAWYLAPTSADPPGPVAAMIFAHGNAELIDHLPDQFRGARSMGLGVLLVEYPGYGRSAGSPSQASITEAMAAGFDYLLTRPDVDPARIVAWGRSLGGGAACALATRRQLAALVLSSTFTSTRAFASQFLLPGFLARDPYDNLSAVTAFDGPVLIFHGAHDDQIPVSHGRRLAAAARLGTLVEYDCAHNDCPPDWEAFWREVGEFLRANGVIATP